MGSSYQRQTPFIPNFLFMKIEPNISVSELRVKKADLEATIKKANDEIQHIDYVLGNFSKEPLQIKPSFSAPYRMPLRQAISQVLLESGRPMQKKDIFKAIKSKGLEFSKVSFSVRLGEMLRANRIEKVAYGTYALKG